MSLFGFLPNRLFTGHNAANTTLLSPRLWSRVSGSIMAADGNKRLFLRGDDFAQFTGATTAYYSENGPYTGFIDTSCTITQPVGFDAGVVKLLQDGTDNDEVWLSPGSATSQLGALSKTASTAYLTAFECRFKLSSVVNDVAAIFLGLAEEGLAATATKTTDTGVMADKDFIGFDSVHTNGGTTGTNAKLTFKYKCAGQTVQTVLATAKTMVADTWYKVGFIFDPSAISAKRITIYVDNVEQGTYVTQTKVEAATFPTDQYLNPLFGSKAGAGTTSSLYLDWWAFAQLIG